jgi:ankyrin repeat protein
MTSRIDDLPTLESVLARLDQYWWALMDDDLLDIPLTRLDQLNVFGEGPIHLAAWKGTEQDIACLVRHGADVNQPGEFGMAPLHYARMGGKRENIQALLDLGAYQEQRSDLGVRPNEGR